MENNLENMWIVHAIYDHVTLESVAFSNYIEAANYANDTIRSYESKEEYRRLINVDKRHTIGHAADQDLYVYLLEVPVRDIELTLGCKLKKKEPSYYPLESCIWLMEGYKELQPGMQKIVESKCSRKFVFPCGIYVRVSAKRKTSKVADVTIYDKDGGYLGGAMVMGEKDINHVRGIIIRALTNNYE